MISLYTYRAECSVTFSPQQHSSSTVTELSVTNAEVWKEKFCDQTTCSLCFCRKMEPPKQYRNCKSILSLPSFLDKAAFLFRKNSIFGGYLVHVGLYIHSSVALPHPIQLTTIFPKRTRIRQKLLGETVFQSWVESSTSSIKMQSSYMLSAVRRLFPRRSSSEHFRYGSFMLSSLGIIKETVVVVWYKIVVLNSTLKR